MVVVDCGPVRPLREKRMIKGRRRREEERGAEKFLQIICHQRGMRPRDIILSGIQPRDMRPEISHQAIFNQEIYNQERCDR
jgi:hypothetical protein